MAEDDRAKRRVISELDTIGRCKQCGAPITEFNKVDGPTGRFCSEDCRQKHEVFIRRAQTLDQTRKKGTTFRILRFVTRRFLGKLIILLILLAFVAFVSVHFEIPVISAIVRNVGLADWIAELTS